MYARYTTPNSASVSPTREASRIGTVENEKTASSANRIMRVHVYFVSPADRAAASNGRNARLKPIHDTMPRRKRCCSGMDLNAAAAGDDNNTKSAAPGTTSVSLRKLISQ